MKKVVWSRHAINHLVAIRDFITQDNPDRAAAVAAQIVDGIDILRQYPNAGRPGRVTGTRELVIPGTPYVIPYRVRSKSLELLAVFHGRQKWPPKL